MNNDNREIFSKNLRYYMEQSGKTQADICRLFKISSATVSNWCNGKIMPRADKIYTLSDWLGVEPSQLITERSRSESTEKLIEGYALLDEKNQQLVDDLVVTLKDKERSPDELLRVVQRLLEVVRPQ